MTGARRGPRSSARLLARRALGPDALRHLSTLRYLGEVWRGAPPIDMLPSVLRTVVRAVRTAIAVQVRPGWLWPRWIEEQIDPARPSFVPRGLLPVLTNLTARNWTMVGSPGSEREAVVDAAGVVTPQPDGWSLDWWIGASDGWHFPSREPGLRQRLLDAMPVVLTSIPIPGGEAVQTAYARLEPGGHVLVEVENRSPDAVEVALAVRPYNPEGLAVVEVLELAGADVVLDGRPALRLPGLPDRCSISRFADADTASCVSNGLAGAPPPGSFTDPAGLLQAAFVYSLPAGGSLRCAASLTGELGEPLDGPGPAEVAVGWRHALSKGMLVSVPDRVLQDAIDANRAFLLLLLDGDDVTAGPHTYHRFWFRDAAYELAALDRWGFHEEAARVISAFPRRQRADGWFFSQWREWDSNGAAIWTIAEHHRLSRDVALARELAPAVLAAVRWIADRSSEPRPGRPEVQGLMPAGVSAEHLGPFDYYYWDDFWSLRGLIDGARLLEVAGDRAGAAEAVAGAEGLWSALAASLDIAAVRLGRPVIPAGPKRGLDPGMIGSLAACYPLRLFDPADERIRETLAAIRERFTFGGAFYQGISHTGLGTYLTLQLAFVELEQGDPAAWNRLRWMLEAASPTFAWPEAIHPRLGGGCMGDGHHGWAAADFLSFVRNALVRETPEGDIALMTMLPEEWKGFPVRVESAPTHRGRLSFELSWEGDHPVLTWECEHPGVRLVAPGLDGRWSTEQQAGSVRFSRER